MLVKKSGIPVMPPMFDNFFRDWSMSNFSETDTTLPAINIRENDDEFIVEVAAPGMDKKDFKLNLENDVLTVSSEKTAEKDDSNDRYMRREYSYQSFERTFNLPKNLVDRDKITANYKNGELMISIPKLEEIKPKPPKLIEIN